MTKEAVHGDYLADMKALHGAKPVLSLRLRQVLVVGVEYGNIGAAIAERLSRDFARVLTPPREELDVTDAGALGEVFRPFPDTDTLVLANGATWMDWIEDYPASEMRRVLNDSLLGSMMATQEFVKATIDAPYHKHIVYIGSMAHRGVLNASAPYCAAKAGLHHFTRCMGWELTPKGYTVVCVHPSNTEGTPMTVETVKHIIRYRGMSRDEAQAYWASINLKQEWLQPEDIAETVSWLVSGKAAYLSGTALELSGGQR